MIYSQKTINNFVKTFGKPLVKFYKPFYGFDILYFEEVFCPENINSDGKSLNDWVVEKYGESAVTLIDTIFQEERKFFKTVLPDNDSLKNKSGKQKYQVIMEDKTIQEVEGEVYYPFALHKDDLWVIDHLPTGLYIYRNKSKSKMLAKIKTWLKKDLDFSAIEITQEMYDYLRAT